MRLTSHLDYINKIDILKKNVSSEYFDSISELVHIIPCKKGQQFILEGTPVNGLYFICSGKVKVLKTGIYGREHILRFVSEGEIVGHRGFGVRDKYGVSAVALEDSILCNFSNEILKKVLLDVPSLTHDLMLFYAEELNKSENKVKAFAQMTVREKVIDTLLYIDRKFGRNTKGFFDIQLSRKEIAEYSGTTVEQVIRVISSLKKEKQLIYSGKQLGIVDIPMLKKEISEHNYFLDS